MAIVILGLAAGGLVNYLVDVLPRKRRFAPPFCLFCEHPQGWLAYLISAPCTACGRRRTWRVWFIECLYVIVAVWLWQTQPTRFGFAIDLMLWVYFGVVIWIDIEHRLILHPVSLVGAVIGLGIGVWLRGWQSTLIGGMVGFAVMLLLYYLGIGFVRLVTRKRGAVDDDEALGFGDVILSGVLGFFLGWPGIGLGLILTILLAGLFSLLYLLSMVLVRKYQRNLAIPYGPFLIASAILLLYFRPLITTRLGW